MITIQFSRNEKIGSRLIRWFTWSKYSHVDIVIAGNEVIGARFDGVKIRTSKDLDSVRFNVDAPDSVIGEMITQIDKKYDWLALFGFLFRRKWEDENKWICSELVAWAFKESGYPLVRSDVWRITPEDILKSPLLMKIEDNENACA